MSNGLDFIFDKLLWLILLLESLFKKRGRDEYVYQKDFLGNKNYSRDLEEIFEPVIATTDASLEAIYSIKATLYNDEVFDKLKYCIERRYWGIFAFTSSSVSQMNDDSYFAQPTIRVYLLLDVNRRKQIVVVKSMLKRFELLCSYPDVDSSLSCFKDRKVVFSKAKDFLSL